jgi:hypothetical protein
VSLAHTGCLFAELLLLLVSVCSATEGVPTCERIEWATESLLGVVCGEDLPELRTIETNNVVDIQGYIYHFPFGLFQFRHHVEE